MASSLPKFVAFKTLVDDFYLRFVKEDVQVHGYVSYDSYEMVTPYTKFEVEPAKIGKGYVNIKCCYSNKYWVCPSLNTRFVAALADEPNEDESKWSCTLFEPIYDSDCQAFRIKHVRLGFYAWILLESKDRNRCLFLTSSTPDIDELRDLHFAVDWESFFILPKRIAFKGGDTGKFLKSILHEEREYQEFSVNDMADPAVGYEVSITRHGDVRIKSSHFDKFWRLSPSWIWADSTDPTENDQDTLFRPVKVTNNIVALRNLGNDHFCIGLTMEGKTDCLNARVPALTNEAHLEVHEPVLSRAIYNTNFKLLDARIYGERTNVIAKSNAVNASNEPKKIDLKFSYITTKTKTWASTLSTKLGVPTTLQSGIPLVAHGQVEISEEFSGEYTWGESLEKSYTIETTYSIVVPPKTKMAVSVLATQGHCDVPFSYNQRDILMNGTTVINFYEDGMYTGVNCYNFKYETKEEPL